MKNYFLLLLFTPFFMTLFAQTAYKDSLWQIVRTGRTDTGGIVAMRKYGEEIANESLDSSSFYLNKSLILSEKINFKKGIGDAYLALSYLEGYLKENKEIGLNYAHIHLNWALKNNLKLDEGNAYFSFAVVYQRIVQYDSAKYYYEKSLTLLEKENPKSLAIIYGNLAQIYDNLYMADKALEYLDKAMIFYQKDRDTIGMIANFITRGVIASWSKDTLAEQAHYMKALKLAEKVNNQSRMEVCYHNLSLVLKDRNKLDSSLFYLNKSLEINKKIGTKRDFIMKSVLKAKIEIDLKKYESALNILEPLIKDTAQAHLTIYNHINFMVPQYFALKALKRYKDANEVIDRYSDFKEASYLQENTKGMLELDEKLKKSEQTKQLLEQENQLVKQRSTITYLFAGLGLTTLLGLGFFYFQRLKTEAKKKELLNLQREQELKATKAKLEGQLNERIRIAKEIHDDLGSSMTSISLLSEVLKKKIDTNIYPEINRISFSSSEMVDKMNEIIWTLNIGNDNVQSLVAYIRKFATNFLDDAQLMLSFEAENLPLEKEIDGSVRRNIYLCVKESMNNIVKHANAHKIRVKIDTNTEGLNINIKDDGKGIDAAHISILGNGLKNMQKRMSDIGGQFLIHNNNGTEITLSYPM
jgi:signal transduction histidine kinase